MEAATMLEEKWQGISNLEGLSTKLVLHRGSGTPAMAGKSNVGCHVVPCSKFVLLLRDCWVRVEHCDGKISKFR